MGILRAALAFIVIFGHSGESHFKLLGNDGGLAVLAFYVISGFYMALITSKYALQQPGWASIRSFYFSRGLRIFPVFWICSLATIILGTFTIYKPSPMPFDVLNQLHLLRDKLFYLFENIFIFGQGVNRFLVVENHHLVLAPLQTIKDFDLNNPLLGQAWSISIELCFYLVVPFILTKSTRVIAIICALSLILRVFIETLGWGNYNTQHAFFPSLLCLFLLGSLTYRLIYRYIDPHSHLVKYIAYLSLLVLSLYAYFLYPYYSINPMRRDWQFLILIILSIPFLFAYFKDSTIDNWLGELSFPLYMTQFLCIGIAKQYSSYPGIVASIGCIFLSLILIYGFIKPIDNYRHTRFIRNQQLREAKNSLHIGSPALAN